MVCSICGETKPRYRPASLKCKQCANALSKAYHAAHREQINARSKARKRANPELTREQDIKSKGRLSSYLRKLANVATKRDRDSDITFETVQRLWWSQGGKCALSGLPMSHTAGHGRIDTNVSLDRKDSKQGYSKDNVQLVCDKVNIMKNSGSDAELVMWAKFLVNYAHKA